MRFPRRLLAANMWYAALLWVAFVVVVMAVALGIHVFGDLGRSVWEQAGQVPRWFALFVGIALIMEFLPLYIAHGQTRRQFGAQAAVTAVLYVPFLAALMTAGFLLESVLYRLIDRPQALDRVHLYAEPAQVPLVFLEYVVDYLAWISAGTLMGAGFYRWRSGGVLTVPLGVGIVVLGMSAIGTEFRMPLSSFALGLDLQRGPLLTLGLGLAAFAAGLAVTWAIIRDVPLRNQA